MLHPRLLVLMRPEGTVQLGWDPDTATLLCPPRGVDPAGLVDLLRLLDGGRSRGQVTWQAADLGIAPAHTAQVLAELDAAGLLITDPEPDARSTSVRVHGRGPLSDALSTRLRDRGVRVSRSYSQGRRTLVADWKVDLVVLADDLVVEPRLAQALVVARLPHLQVRLRDGKGIVGPLVLPGSTSCLRCADLTRCDFDAEWPHLAAQLLGRVGYADTATVQATAAVALGQLEIVLAGSSHPAQPAPSVLDATVEVDLATHTLGVRRWERHELCDCVDVATP